LLTTSGFEVPQFYIFQFAPLPSPSLLLISTISVPKISFSSL
jgi:hypothetical protein